MLQLIALPPHHLVVDENLEWLVYHSGASLLRLFWKRAH